MKEIYTISDYIYWRGDLKLEKEPFNEVDALILGMVCYLDFSGVIPGLDSKRIVTLREAVTRFDGTPYKDRKLGVIIPDDIHGMVQDLSLTPRFYDAKVFAYENIVDEQQEMQFCALSFRLSDGSIFVSFRGTDDTIVGWKENFNMCYMSHVPAQEQAARYLNRVAREHDGPIRIGGHSKGGNLAIWSAVNCDEDVKNRIVRVYSNDGPGFTPEMVRSEAYQAMRKKCMTYVPQSSVVGMMMEHDENYQLIYSNRNGLWQHDPYSWAVDRDHFLYVDERSSFGEHYDTVLRELMDSMTPAERKSLTEDMFQVLEATGAKTLTELTSTRGTIKKGIKALMDYDRPRRRRIAQMLRLMLTAQVESAVPENDLLSAFQDKLEKIERNSPVDFSDWRDWFD